MALQASKWPPLYEVAMPARTVGLEAEVSARLHVLLPHELLAVLVEHSDAPQLWGYRKMERPSTTIESNREHSF